MSAPWATVDDVRDRWADAPFDDELLEQMLEAAHAQVEAYAPSLTEGDPVPQRYVEAEVLQLRNLYQAQQREGDILGFSDGYAIRVRDLSQDVKALLRPRVGKPRLG